MTRGNGSHVYNSPYLQVARNLDEMNKFGRVLSDGERKELRRLEKLSEQCRAEGWNHADQGGKMKHNPYPGDSLEWWSWHEGYKAAKACSEAAKRAERYK